MRDSSILLKRMFYHQQQHHRRRRRRYTFRNLSLSIITRTLWKQQLHYFLFCNALLWSPSTVKRCHHHRRHHRYHHHHHHHPGGHFRYYRYQSSLFLLLLFVILIIITTSTTSNSISAFVLPLSSLMVTRTTTTTERPSKAATKQNFQTKRIIRRKSLQSPFYLFSGGGGGVPLMKTSYYYSKTFHKRTTSTIGHCGSLLLFRQRRRRPSFSFRQQQQQQQQRYQQNTNKPILSSMTSSSSTTTTTTTQLHMVLTTPESIFEEEITKSKSLLLDNIIDDCVRTNPKKSIMKQFDPSSKYLWKCWYGTVFSETWTYCIKNMVYATIILFIIQTITTISLSSPTTPVGVGAGGSSSSSSSSSIFSNYYNLSGFDIIWNQLLSITTFTLTFFVNQSYALWKKCYGLSRELQGNLNDINLLLAAYASRKDDINDGIDNDNDNDNNDDESSVVSSSSPPVQKIVSSSPSQINDDSSSNIVPSSSISLSSTTNGDDLESRTTTMITTPSSSSSLLRTTTTTTTYTAKARRLLGIISRYVRLFHLLTYASFTSSHRPLLTPRGMKRLVDRGLLTSKEREILVNAEIPATKRHNIVLLWIIRLYIEGRNDGSFHNSSGCEQQYIEKICNIRSISDSFGGRLMGRMPLSYAHIVQVLVDVTIWMYPIMTYTTLDMTPWLCIVGTGLLTMFYHGLLNLAKQFLDPYDNENYGNGDDPLCVNTLIAETNSGSVRWIYSLENTPFTSTLLNDSILLSNYLLPLRGYTTSTNEEEKTTTTTTTSSSSKQQQELKDQNEYSSLSSEEVERQHLTTQTLRKEQESINKEIIGLIDQIEKEKEKELKTNN